MRSSPWLPALCLTLLAAGAPASAQQPDASAPAVAPTSDVPAGPAPVVRPERPPLGDMGSANAPSVHLRYGDLDLDIQCSTRDDAKACADAAVAIVDHLDVQQRDDAGSGGSGDSPDRSGGSEDRGDDN